MNRSFVVYGMESVDQKKGVSLLEKMGTPAALERKALWQEGGETLRLAGPLVVAYAGNQMMGLVDTAIVGRLGSAQIAGTSAAASLFFVVAILGMGVMMALDPLASQSIGAERPHEARRILREAIYLAVMMTIPLSFLMVVSLQVLPWFGFDAETQREAHLYLWPRMLGLFPLLMYTALRGYLQALSLGRPVMIATLLANLANIPLSVGLAWGGQLGWGGEWLPWGLAQGWGTAGVACATTLVTIFQVGVLVVVYRGLPHEGAPSKASWKGIQSLWWLGWPIALQHLAEVGLFVLTTLLMGHFGKVFLGGHEVALKIASFTFTMCLGVGQATSVRVGYAVGRRDPQAARRAGWIGGGVGITLMATSALCLVLFGHPLASLFAKQPEVVHTAVSFLGIAALFQLVDGVQVVATGALRGAGDTRTPLLLGLTSHWLIGVPVGVGLAFRTSMGARGLWWGLCAGLAAAALFLSVRFFYLTRGDMRAVMDR
ncbi:MAG: MATE family efflux transporter [Myxococcales bacterium]|nr:MATE family efflux transporter [Myxococcales bacterium]